MQKTSDKSLYLVVSALLSILVHCLIILFSGEIPLRALPPSLDLTSEKLPRRMQVRSVELPPTLEEQRNVAEKLPNNDLAEQLSTAMEKTRSLREIFEEENILPPEEPRLVLAEHMRKLAQPKSNMPAIDIRKVAAPRPEILALKGIQLTPEEMGYRPVIPDVPRTVATQRLPSLFHDASGSMPTLEVSLKIPGGTGGAPPPNLDDLIRDKTPETASLTPSSAPPPPTPSLDPSDVGREDMRQIDQLLTMEMVVYKDKDGSGYFRLDVSPNPRSDRLRAVPKDVMLLIDCSDSISPTKLEKFKLASYNALEYLNMRDRFNIVSFRTDPRPLFDAYVPVESRAIEKARRYIRHLERGGMTDVYAGLVPFVGGDTDNPNRPLTIFILTDGNSTVKDHLNNQQLLRRVAAANRPSVSIYSVSAGEEANRTLLDLLALTNRGLPLHQAQLEGFTDQLIRFIATHSDIIVSELDYNVTGGLATDIYPKKLPHLYRNETLSVYGRFPKGTREIAVQLIGRNAEGKLEEVVFKGDVDKSRSVGKELRSDWLAHKAFNMLVQSIIAPSPQQQARLEDFVKTHGIQLPYLNNLNL
jgi:Mg-chelatase subunit ChlD